MVVSKGCVVLCRLLLHKLDLFFRINHTTAFIGTCTGLDNATSYMDENSASDNFALFHCEAATRTSALQILLCGGFTLSVSGLIPRNMCNCIEPHLVLLYIAAGCFYPCVCVIKILFTFHNPNSKTLKNTITTKKHDNFQKYKNTNQVQRHQPSTK